MHTTMPLVRLTEHRYQISPELPLKQLLMKEGGMDGSEADAAIHRLVKGKFVDVSFDLGEDEAARAFMRNATALGLEAKLHLDEPLSWTRSRPRPWFLRLALAVLVGFGICVWLSVRWPNAFITKLSGVVEGLVIICWLWLPNKRPRAQEQKDEESKLSLWWRLGSIVFVVVILTIISEPMLGLVLLTLVLGGIGFAFLIRMMNRD